jgi:hypothetical protein
MFGQTAPEATSRPHIPSGARPRIRRLAAAAPAEAPRSAGSIQRGKMTTNRPFPCVRRSIQRVVSVRARKTRPEDIFLSTPGSG